MMNISSECLPTCEVACTQPYAYSRSLEPCVTSCGDSRAVVYPPPVVLTFPGPTLASCSQESIVGTSIPQPYGPAIQYGSEESYGMGGSVGTSGNGVSFGDGGVSGMGGYFGSQGSVGYGGMSGMGGSAWCGGVSGMGGSFGKGGSFGFGGSSRIGSCYSKQSYRSHRGSRFGIYSSF
uniref:Keratin n=1 Tax=Gallus gallus TaxID=9031 RepID=A0A8V1AA44_CHICK